jgi:hypothetical protein
LDAAYSIGRVYVRLFAVYTVYLVAGIAMMIWFRIGGTIPLVERCMATIWFWTFCWAINYTYVKWLGKMFRRQDEKDKM